MEDGLISKAVIIDKTFHGEFKTAQTIETPLGSPPVDRKRVLAGGVRLRSPSEKNPELKTLLSKNLCDEATSLTSPV